MCTGLLWATFLYYNCTVFLLKYKIQHQAWYWLGGAQSVTVEALGRKAFSSEALVWPHSYCENPTRRKKDVTHRDSSSSSSFKTSIRPSWSKIVHVWHVDKIVRKVQKSQPNSLHIEQWEHMDWPNTGGGQRPNTKYGWNLQSQSFPEFPLFWGSKLFGGEISPDKCLFEKTEMTRHNNNGPSSGTFKQFLRDLTHIFHGFSWVDGEFYLTFLIVFFHHWG